MKILVIAPSWIGDAIMSQTMHRLLVQNHPNTKIDIITSTWNKALFYRMPEIHRVLTLTLSKHGSFPLKKYYQYGKLLQKNQYQQSIILPNSFKSALIPFFAGIQKRTGWRGEMRYRIINDIRILDTEKFPLMIERYAALAFKKEKIKNTLDLPHPLPLPYLHYHPQELHIILKKFNITTKNKTQIRIGICPGAEFSKAKRWPTYHYARLVLKLIRQGYQTILLGSHKEREIGISINNSIPRTLQIYCYNLIGLTSLDEAILLIKKCHAIISNDSGLMHIACALHKPVVALYGPSDPNCTPPLYHHTKIIKMNTHKTYKQPINHSYYNLDGYDSNLINIQPHTVLETLHTLL